MSMGLVEANGLKIIEANADTAWFQIDYDLLGQCGLPWAEEFAHTQAISTYERDQEDALRELVSPANKITPSEIAIEISERVWLNEGQVPMTEDDLREETPGYRKGLVPASLYPGGEVGFMDLRYPLTGEELGVEAMFARFPTWNPASIASGKLFYKMYEMGERGEHNFDLEALRRMSGRAFVAATDFAFSETGRETEYYGFNPALFPYRQFSADVSQTPEIHKYINNCQKLGRPLLTWELYERLLPANY